MAFSVRLPNTMAAVRAAPCRPRLFGAPRRGAAQLVRAADAEEVEEEIELMQMDAEERMQKTIDSVQENFASVRTGRATPNMLDRIEVDYYGAMTPLKQVASVNSPDAQSLLVKPFDMSALQNIEKAIMQSDLGITPQNDGQQIRLNVPPLTADRRKEMTKLVSSLAEDGKVALRNVRRDAMKAVDKLKKDKSISEDRAKELGDGVEDMMKSTTTKLEKLTKEKNEDLMKV